MVKTLVKHGNSHALVIDKAILELLRVTPETPFDIMTDGQVLVLTPVRDEQAQADFEAAVERMHEQFGKHDLRIILVVPTLYRSTKLADAVLAKLKAHFPGRTAKTVIGYNVKIDEAQSHGKTIWEYASWSRGAHMLESLAQEILKA